MLRFKRSWEDGSYQEGHGSDAETQSVWTKFSWFSSLLKEGFGYVMFSCSSIDLPRLAPSVIFVPPGAFQNLHLNVIAGSVLLFSSLGALEVKLQLSSNCPFMYPLEKGWDCFLLNSWQNFCWYTGEQYLVLVLHVTTKKYSPWNQSQMNCCGGMNFMAHLGGLLWGIQTTFWFLCVVCLVVLF